MLIKDYIAGLNNGAYTVIQSRKQIYRFKSFIFDDSSRRVRGLFQVGTFGRKGDIIDIKTGNVDYQKLESNAEIIDYYVDILLPSGMNEGICLMLNHGGDGVKTLLYDLLSENFKVIVKRPLQMRPLPYLTAYKQWLGAKTKEIKLVKFSKCDDIADRLKSLGHGEQTLIINPGRKKDLGKLEEFFKQGTDEHQLLEVLTPMCEQVRTKVVINGKTRTFRMGKNLPDQVCQIELDEKEVPCPGGNPDIPSLIKWCNKLLAELASNLYKGVKVPI
ncbi:hypothetical protein P2Q70_01100 [Pseudomonas mendocina]|uniref:hypothetical protein n=1 Tax=Ectopseudomonas mendocina TaxID=300 RepID=UPI0023DB675D|nr:hypothetical protein [Pseudomonas mendocina]MDF2073171.1 hypothetical protein [Pseudomonas mendocina]